MPEQGVAWRPREALLTFEEVERLVRAFADAGVRKVRLTGGEPTVRRGLPELVRRLTSIVGSEGLYLTTNGLLLEGLAAHLREAGLRGVNVSLDTLRPDRFEAITRRTGLDRAIAGVWAALREGLEVKINVVVIPGTNDDEAADFVRWAAGMPVAVRFIEFMPFLANGWSPGQVVTSTELRGRLEREFRLRRLPGAPNDVAAEYEVEGASCRVGFVSSVSESFCGGCNRLRLTADGQFKTCLFLPPSLDLRAMLRSGADDGAVIGAVREALLDKWAGHPPMRSWRQLDTLAMVEIGG